MTLKACFSLVLITAFAYNSLYAKDSIVKGEAEPWERTYPFELFSGYNFPQNAVDVSLKIQLINRKSGGVGVRFGRMKTAPQKMNLLIGNECYLNRSVNGLKIGLDFTPFYRVKFSTVAPHHVFVFSDFLYYTIGQLYVRANYVYYFNGKQTNDQCIRPEIGISPYFQLWKKRDDQLMQKGMYRFYHIYLHPSISYGYNLDLNSTNTLAIHSHQITICISISYEAFYPVNSSWPRRMRKQFSKASPNTNKLVR
jgi:hypothetical protein